MTPRLAKSVEDMVAFCPDFIYQPEVLTDGGWWTGEHWPLRTLDQLQELLDDIHHHRAIFAAWRGELCHLANCRADHHRHEWMEKIQAQKLLRPFRIRIYYAGGQDHPRAWVDGIDGRNARHLWGDGSLCPFMASEDAWSWTHHTVADFIGHVSVWLVSWVVWQQTGVWLAGEHESTPGYHLAHVRPNDQCWCRSGKKYRKCHMHMDQAAVFKFGR